jgi:hypothetical protein
MTLSQRFEYLSHKEMVKYIFYWSLLVVLVSISWSEPDCPSIKGSSPYIYTKSILLIVPKFLYIWHLSDLLIGPTYTLLLYFTLFPTSFRGNPSFSGTYPQFPVLTLITLNFPVYPPIFPSIPPMSVLSLRFHGDGRSLVTLPSHLSPSRDLGTDPSSSWFRLQLRSLAAEK